MALDPTRFSRVSIGFVSSNQSVVDVDAGDTGDVFSVTGGAAFQDVSLSGAFDTSSTISVADQATLDGGISVGGGTNITVISSATQTLTLG